MNIRLESSEAIGRRGTQWWPGLAVYLVGVTVYVIPMVVNFLRTPIFVYVNAWDEITYLTYQGASATAFRPGYAFSSLVVRSLHELGIAGAVQNVIFDLVVPVILFFVLGRSFVVIGNCSIRRSLLLSFGGLFFGPVINFSNAMVRASSWINSERLVAARETFLPVLRSPQPQASWLLLAVVGIWVLKTRKPSLFWLPLPLLYWTTGLWVFYFLIAWESRRAEELRRRPLLLQLVTAAIFTVCVAMIYGVVVRGFLVRTNPFPIYGADMVRLSLPAIVVAAAWILVELVARIDGVSPQSGERQSLLLAVTASLVLANINLLPGVNLDLKSPQGYEGTLIAGLAVAWALHRVFNAIGVRVKILRPAVADTVIIALILFGIIPNCMAASGFDWRTRHYQIVGAYDFGPELDWIVEHPTECVIPDRLWGSSRSTVNRLALARPKMAAPLFAWQYHLGAWATSCEEYIPAHEKTWVEIASSPQWAMLSPDKKAYFTTALERLESSWGTVENFRTRDCPGWNAGPEVRIVTYSEDGFLITFP